MSNIEYFGSSDLLYLLNLMKSEYEKYVLAVAGKGLSTNDFTNELLAKLNGIATGAEVNVQSDWSQSTDTADDYIKNKPTLGTASALNVAVTGNAAAGEVVKGNDTRLTDARTPVAHTHTKSEITDFPALGTASAKDVAASGNASASQVVMGNDSRLSDARPASNVTDTYSATGTAPVSGKAVAAALATITGISFESYSSFADLPAVGKVGVIYLVPNSGSAPNVKDEYFWNTTANAYELFGTTQLDLSNYVQKSELVELTEAEVTAAWNSVFGS